MLPFTRVPFWVPIFDPQPHEGTGLLGMASLSEAGDAQQVHRAAAATTTGARALWRGCGGRSIAAGAGFGTLRRAGAQGGGDQVVSLGLELDLVSYLLRHTFIDPRDK